MGAVYQCHQERKLDESEHRPCAGWAIDQKKRNLPSLALRMLLMKSDEACDWLRRLNKKEKGLFRSLGAMCKANGVRGSLG